MIRSGLPHHLRTLYVCLFKQFKSRPRSKWPEWMSSEDEAVTNIGNFKKYEIVNIVEGIKDAGL